jgi:hypothetical protein
MLVEVLVNLLVCTLELCSELESSLSSQQEVKQEDAFAHPKIIYLVGSLSDLQHTNSRRAPPEPRFGCWMFGRLTFLNGTNENRMRMKMLLVSLLG